ncbi:RNA polymerase factor sigma-54 [Paenibacillus albidus]|uniref:RNA polymerase factor sigma-54 n=1 Tax=Paenibacillus albidus TaxID=2041023 RepID=UPI001BEA0ED7|nr:RNA polymerase factor sigma-54 [Paenibacillus albidus]MBT2287744.1 RNA polymerase factor sigma-54 [Paenibacillus albidus]
MAVELSLMQSQSQQLSLSREMRQGLEILQLSIFDLSAYIERQCEENPMLEQLEAQENTFEATPWTARRTPFSGELKAVRQDTLEEVLLHQLNCISGLPEPVIAAARYLIGNINDRGYLVLPVEELEAEWGLAGAVLREALEVVQGFEPAGVGAATLSECLLLQLRRLVPRQPLAEALAAGYLDILAAGKLKSAAARLFVTSEEIFGAYRSIQSLNPYPGACFGGGTDSYVIPDLYIRTGLRGYEIFCNESALPAVMINRHYDGMMNAMSRTSPELRFLKGYQRSAKWLVKCIEERKKTLLLVGRAMLEHQLEFVARGKASLKPLTLRMVADRIGLHESTVSRAVNGKYVQTPGGLYELKDLLCSALNATGGEVSSVPYVQSRIRELIREEDPVKPLSDQRLSEQLAAEGLTVARRTVAKYREELGLSSAALRRSRQ